MAPGSADERLRRLQALAPRAAGEQRREQLVRIAAYIVECEGIDALRHARIAELAGCARPLVYNYFPKKSDLYIAITEAFYQRLDQQFSCEEQYRAVLGVLAGDWRATPAIAALVQEVLDEYGGAGLILRTIPEVNEAFREYHEQLAERYENRWLRYFLELGLSGLRARLLLENCISVARNAVQALAAGDLHRDEALDLALGNMAALIRHETHRARQGAAAGSSNTN